MTTTVQPDNPDFFIWAWNHKLLMIPIVLALVLSVCSGMVGLIYISALNAIQSHPLHFESLQIARQNQQVLNALGEPLAGGVINAGEIQVDEENQHGNADVEIPISGPRGKGKLLVKAKLVAGNWKIQQLVASLEGGGVIELPISSTRVNPETE